MRFLNNELVRVVSFPLPEQYREQGLFYYDVRRNFFSEPESIEPHVVHDHYATIAFTAPLDLGPDNVLVLSDDEREDLVYAMMYGVKTITSEVSA